MEAERKRRSLESTNKWYQRKKEEINQQRKAEAELKQKKVLYY